jgi:hypothetical protein
MNYHVTASHWDRGWELHIDGVGVTQTRTLEKAESMVRDYLRLDGHSNWSSAHIDVDFDLGGLEHDVYSARQAVSEAAEAQREAAAFSRKVVQALRAHGVSVSDAARILGVSRGRISQLSAH